MKNNNFIEISTPVGSFDYLLFSGISWNAPEFNLSEFCLDEKNTNRYLFKFHKTELPNLFNRLMARGQEEYIFWCEDIKRVANEKFGTKYEVF